MEIKAQHGDIKSFYQAYADISNDPSGATLSDNVAMTAFLEKEINDLPKRWEIRCNPLSLTETESRPVGVGHTWHDGNKDKSGVLYTILVNCNTITECQGGLIEIKGYPQTPHHDNFGKWKGNPNEVHQPQWLNELGTIILFPGTQYWGVDRVWHGERKILMIEVIGKRSQ